MIYKEIYYSPTVIAEMRNWISDCTWAEDSFDAEELTDLQCIQGVERHYEGGLAEFLECCKTIT